MTEEKLKEFKDLYNEFFTKCEKICGELKRFKRDYGYCNEFIPMDNNVYCRGHEYWSYGGHEEYEEYEEYFPTILLTYTEEEVKNHVDNLLSLAEEEKRRKTERLEKEKEKKYKEYEN